MSENSKWQALSMRDRAFLIREAVRNGITDMNSIIDLYNQREHSFSGEEDIGVWDRISSFFTKKEPVDNRETAGPVDLEEIKIRQAWAESRFNDSAKSSAGAMGRFQIMPAVQQDYIKATGKKGSLTNRKYNEAVRDWMMDESLANREWIIKGNATDSVKMGKQLAAYNLGPTSTLRALQKAKNAGLDIYDSFDWLSTEYFPKETVDYVQWILRGKPTGSHRNNEVFEKNRHLYTK